MSSPPFFHPESLSVIDTFPRTSVEWQIAVNQISEDIKNAEALLRSQFREAKDFCISVSVGEFRLQASHASLRLCYFSVSTIEARPMIELSLADRIEAYRYLPELFDRLVSSKFANDADTKAKNVASKTVLEVIREAFDRVKLGVLAGPKLERLVEDLKQLRIEAPKDDSDFKRKAGWFKRLAELLAESDIFRQVFDQVKVQIPQIWSQLTFRQKLKVGTWAPIIGAGTYLGSIGIVGAGGAVGVPMVLVILLFLLLSHSLIDFLDYVIKQLSIISKNQPSPETVSRVFEEVLNTMIKSVFGRDHDINSAVRAQESAKTDETDPRSFETIAVAALAKKYGGVGYVTRYSSDGGIDGYIICEAKKEVLLVQAKLYKGKIGFPEATQYLGTYFYWKRALESKFPYPISKMVLACSTDYSIEAKKVADAFADQLILERVPC